MAWPSGTKASTANVDAGSDSPINARADIKQNIDNVNAIIDEFDIASPSNNDILQYNSTSGAWEPGASTIGTSLAVLNVGTGEENVTGNVYRAELTESFDPNGIVALSGSYQFTLTAGTYYLEMEQFIDSTTEGVYVLYNESDSTTELTFSTNQIGTVTENYHFGSVVLTPASSKNYSFRQDAVSVGDRNSRPNFRIFK